VRPSVINQYPSQDSTVDRLGGLLSDFSGLAGAQFRALIAFASEAGLRMLEPGVRRFLDSQHSIFWIVGVDLGGTGREALEFLYKLKREYPKQNWEATLADPHQVSRSLPLQFVTAAKTLAAEWILRRPNKLRNASSRPSSSGRPRGSASKVR
jgi:hypothetical protein